MAHQRSAFGGDTVPAKRQKMSSEPSDPRSNPYLAHMYDSSDANGHSNGYSTPPRGVNGGSSNGPLSKFPRHKTTAALAKGAEDGKANPFTGEPFSQRYLSILKTRRDLPVHAQRYGQAYSE